LEINLSVTVSVLRRYFVVLTSQLFVGEWSGDPTTGDGIRFAKQRQKHEKIGSQKYAGHDLELAVITVYTGL
jgi:hypothetical protein